MELSYSAIASPPILFFVLGFGAKFLRTDLRLPEAISRFFAVYLLVVIGFEGGVKIATSPSDPHLLMVFAFGFLAALWHPVLAYFITRKKIDRQTSIALSSSYGSVSVVTFIAALNYLEVLEVNSSSYFIAVLAVMEFPAILVGVLLHGRSRESESAEGFSSWELLREAVFGFAPLILLGSFLIGGLTGEAGSLELGAFTKGLFKGFLSIYLLDLGARAASELKRSRLGLFHFSFGVLFPIFKGLVGCAIGIWILGLSRGDCLLLAMLFASASYIAVPAAMSTMLPKANRGVYVTLPLAITFPFNVLFGIPLFYYLISLFSGAR